MCIFHRQRGTTVPQGQLHKCYQKQEGKGKQLLLIQEPQAVQDGIQKILQEQE